MTINLDNQEIRDLVEDATRHHGAPWKRVVSSDGSFYGVTDRNGAVVAGSPAVTALIAQAPTLIPEVLDRLEQAEQAVLRVRDVIKGAPTVDPLRGFAGPPDDWPDDTDFTSYGEWIMANRVCEALDTGTRRLADQGLGDNLARTTKNGDA